jgi:predicted homoserine dehydrogenase-like protein
MNPKMLSAFKDGSKTMVELAAMSNATGLVPDVPGMHGARADVPDLNKVFVPQEDGGILSRRGVCGLLRRAGSAGGICHHHFA